MKNWKTTIVGALAGAGIVALELIKNGSTDIKTVVVGFALADLGAVAKDNNVTGGTTQQ